MADPEAIAIAPGGVIGILGGGQLGRMTALAAARLGYRCHIFAPEAGGPAAQVSAAETIAEYDDRNALSRFAAAIDVATFEFENVPVASVDYLLDKVPVRPGPKALAAAQDRMVEKTFLRSIGVPTVPFIEVNDVAALSRAVDDLGTPAVLKTARLGYDGKGQVLIEPGADIGCAFRQMGADRGVLEKWIDFRMEISVIIARGLDGATVTFDPAENRHKNHILDTSIAPARLSPELSMRASEIAARIASKLDLIGLLAVELFVTREDTLLVNEIAPRPHNSGHWSMNACRTCQFEQFVRAICGQPLGSTVRYADAVMTNLIGNRVNDWPLTLKEPNAHLHLYGKNEAREGRKMGHINRTYPLGSLAEESAN
ncbi:MAG: 5-(carboxyamino)imidazole ribonucleotide synthase [Alphaproteobacteria bacterium]|nr:5-(carboxyamino)imidazole ribonucleotide synthase [Alphaproteobacteria bacterium]